MDDLEDTATTTATLHDGDVEPADSALRAGEPGPEAGFAAALSADRDLAALAALLRELGDRLACERSQEVRIARLHEELQAYRNDLVREPARQLLRGIIRLHDDLGRIAAALRGTPADELTAGRFFRHLADFQEDLELLLAQHGVERFAAPGESFDPRRQRALRTVPTADPDRVGELAERLRPGFEQGELLLQKERVAVYVEAPEPPRAAR